MQHDSFTSVRTSLELENVRRPRLFNSSQHIALFLASGGSCALCHGPLGSDWEADHVLAYSKGGETDVVNGNALCKKCNRKKGDKDGY